MAGVDHSDTRCEQLAENGQWRGPHGCVPGRWWRQSCRRQDRRASTSICLAPRDQRHDAVRNQRVRRHRFVVAERPRSTLCLLVQSGAADNGFCEGAHAEITAKRMDAGAAGTSSDLSFVHAATYLRGVARPVLSARGCTEASIGQKCSRAASKTARIAASRVEGADRGGEGEDSRTDDGLEKCKDHSCQHRRPLVGIETRHCGVHLHQPSLMSIASESESIGPIRSRVQAMGGIKTGLIGRHRRARPRLRPAERGWLYERQPQRQQAFAAPACRIDVHGRRLRLPDGIGGTQLRSRETIPESWGQSANARLGWG